MTLDKRIAAFEKFMDGKIPDGMSQSLLDSGFFTAPASTKYHGAYEGGLFDHSFAVAEQLVGLTVSNALKWKKERSPYVVGMFHDLCKMDSYIPIYGNGNDTTGWNYNPDTFLKGHGDKSVIILAQYLTPLTEEEILCIRYHMGAFTDKDEWKDYTRAVNQCPNVLWTHHADMLASHVMGI